jgi:hypothetical protein
MPNARDAHLLLIDHFPQALNPLDIGARESAVPRIAALRNNQPFSLVHANRGNGHTEKIGSLADRE